MLDQGAVKFTVPEVPMAAAVPPLPNEPQSKIIVAAPSAEPLARGVAFIRYSTENLQIVPVFGSPPLRCHPRSDTSM